MRPVAASYWERLLAFSAFAAIVFGSKLWLIGAYGNATPFWDQWSVEAENLYQPFLRGTLHCSDMFTTANEHRIFTTRLLDLGLLAVNGLWNPLLQMVVNAALHAATLTLFIALLARTIGREHLPALLLFAGVFFSVPYAWENTLWGFQSQYYFVLLFSIACLWFTVTRPPLSAAWWAGAASGLLAFLSCASGICAPFAAATVGLMFYGSGLRRTRGQLLAVAILAAMAILAAALTPAVAGHEVLKPSSISKFLRVWAAVLGWPISWRVVGAILVCASPMAFAAVMLRRRPPAGSYEWFLLALVVWSIVQSVGIAYSRAACSLSTRYLDLYSIGILVNLACSLWLAQDRVGKQLGWRGRGVAVWASVLLIALGAHAVRHLPGELGKKRDNGLAQQRHTKAYLDSGDFQHLADKPLYDIPYPDPQPLASTLASPQIRSILPATLRADGRTGRLDGPVTWLLAHYYLFLMLGLAAVLELAKRSGRGNGAVPSAVDRAKDSAARTAGLSRVDEQPDVVCSRTNRA
jgi:hypothetical protein